MLGVEALRPRAHDLGPIAEAMWQAWKADGFIIEKDREEWLAYLHGELPNSPWQSFVIRDGEAIVGFISLTPVDAPDALHLSPWLANQFVMPSHRGQGLATQLEHAVEAEALKRGHKLLHIWAAPGSEAYHAHQGYTWLNPSASLMVKSLV